MPAVHRADIGRIIAGGPCPPSESLERGTLDPCPSADPWLQKRGPLAMPGSMRDPDPEY